MDKQIPLATIQTIARSIFKEASTYGFGQLDIIRLVNELMDYSSSQGGDAVGANDPDEHPTLLTSEASSLPLTAERLIIRPLVQRRTSPFWSHGCRTNMVDTSYCLRLLHSQFPLRNWRTGTGTALA